MVAKTQTIIRLGCTLITLFFLWNSASCIPPSDDKRQDVLEMIYSVADELDMKVMCDIDLRGGDLYQKSTVAELTGRSDKYIQSYHDKYGHHTSFWGWYLNNEINPIENSDIRQSAYWRAIWKSIVDKAREVDPETKVTISPFFLLDKESLRGFKYQEPTEYEEWWYHTMKETGIDILMLQDSGAEHLSFYTLDDRRPFFQAFANACERAGKEFWLNVETGQVEARDWAHALQMEKDFERAWAFTEIDWLAQKLELAAEYGTGIINWGYYPLMNPSATPSALTIQDIDGQPVDLSKRKANYEAYRDYVRRVPNVVEAGKKATPKINGTLWFLPPLIEQDANTDLELLVRKEIEQQKALGFEYLWICNTPDHFTP